jgi:hypothetical protein
MLTARPMPLPAPVTSAILEVMLTILPESFTLGRALDLRDF